MIHRLILTIPLLALSTGCSTISVNHSYDREFDLAPPKTYAWVARPTSPRGGRAESIDFLLKDLVNRQLSAKGFARSESPDLLLTYHLGRRDEVDVVAQRYRVRPARAYRGAGVRVSRRTEGTLIIDVIDARSSQMVWRAIAESTLRPDASVDERVEKLEAAVAKAFEKLPPPD